MPTNYKLTTNNSIFKPKLTDTVPVALIERLGAGLAIPLSLFNNSWTVVNGTDKVKQDVVMAVITPVGRRMVFPSFGSLVPYLMFEEWTPITQSQIADTTFDAVNNWVPTVSNVTVQIDETNIAKDQLGINIFYSIKGTDSTDSVTIILYNNPNDQLPPGNFHLNARYLFQV